MIARIHCLLILPSYNQQVVQSCTRFFRTVILKPEKTADALYCANIQMMLGQGLSFVFSLFVFIINRFILVSIYRHLQQMHCCTRNVFWQVADNDATKM